MGDAMETERSAQADAAVRAGLEDRLRLTVRVLRGVILERLLHDGAHHARRFDRRKPIAFPELTTTPEDRDHE